VMLNAGADAGGDDNETWVYDLSANTWTQKMMTGDDPEFRKYHAMAAVGGDQVMLYGGDLNSYDQKRTFIYDLSANTWTGMVTSICPTMQTSPCIAQIGPNKALLFGNNEFYDSTYTWVYDLSSCTWRGMMPDFFPEREINSRPGMSYIVPDHVLIFGVGPATPDKTYLYDLNMDNWTQLLPGDHPSAHLYQTMEYIGADHVLLFGGFAFDDETWVYDLSESTWTQRLPINHPPARERHAMAFLGSDQVLLFGGWGYVDGKGYQAYDDTWVYDFNWNIWTEMSPATRPSARYYHAMASIGGDRVLLFGGSSGAGETWMYDLSENTWTQLSPATHPSGRHLHGMASLGGNQVLLFGGRDENADGETWLFRGPDTTPPEAVDDLSVQLEDGAKSATGNMYLWWSEPDDNYGVTRYVICRATAPEVIGDSLAGTEELWYIDAGAAGDTLVNYYYTVRAVDGAGNKSEHSNKVGEFDRNLMTAP